MMAGFDGIDWGRRAAGHHKLLLLCMAYGNEGQAYSQLRALVNALRHMYGLHPPLGLQTWEAR